MNKTGTYRNLEVQYQKLFRHIKLGSFKTRERYGKAFVRFMVFAAEEYGLQKLANISEKHITAYVQFMQRKGLSASTIKTDLAAIRFFHDQMPYTRYTLPDNTVLLLEQRTFGGVDRTWNKREFDLMCAKAINLGAKDCLALLTLGRYAGLRLEECFRVDTNAAKRALDTGILHVKGKGGLERDVPIDENIRTALQETLQDVPTGQKLFVQPDYKTHLAMKRLQSFIAYHRKAFTQRQITFHGLRHTFAQEQYEKLIQDGASTLAARKAVSELLGHHRDDVTRIYLSQTEGQEC